MNPIRCATAVLVVLLGLGAAARPACAEETVEEALGAASGMALYEAQMVLGLSADAFAKKVYDEKTMAAIISEQKTLLKNLDRHLENLLDEESVSKDDKKAIRKLRACISRLNETADALQDFVDDSSQENAEAWQEKRKASYAEIADLLGIEKK